MSDANPYASPVPVDEPPPALPSEIAPATRADFLRALARWSVICCISAAPSFFVAFGLHGVRYTPAMILGVLTFIVGYAYVECLDRTRKLTSRPSVRTTLRIGYITRIAVSIIFPIGFFIDIFPGALSTAVTEWLMKTGTGHPYGVDDQELMKAPFFSMNYVDHFCGVYFNTVLQGVFLNAILAVYMLLWFGLLRLFTPARAPLQEIHLRGDSPFSD